ncbi:hypothetical protein GEW_09297, partial [Pasteurella multocida subsp. gallicida str. Anand1_poultry]
QLIDDLREMVEKTPIICEETTDERINSSCHDARKRQEECDWHGVIPSVKRHGDCGWVLFIALIVMSCYSLVGRKLGNGGVLGDIEIMQMGCAVAASLFL